MSGKEKDPGHLSKLSNEGSASTEMFSNSLWWGSEWDAVLLGVDGASLIMPLSMLFCYGSWKSGVDDVPSLGSRVEDGFLF